VEGTQAEWGRNEPAPRWRALLDRALLGSQRNEQDEASVYQSGNGHAQPQRAAFDRPALDRPPYSAPRYEEPAAYPQTQAAAYQQPGYPHPGQPAPPGYRPPPAQPYPPQGHPAPGNVAVYSGQAAAPPAAHIAPQRRPEVVPDWRTAAPNETDALVASLRRDLGRPRVIAFANPKGGVHKTTATVLAAATIGSARGRGVIAWDDNELRGTLGLRAGSARHARTIRHLIQDLDAIEASGGYALTERLDDYLRHASDGSYDVLAGEENPRFAHRLDPATVRRVVELLCRTHDVICVDTGNNVESTNWQTVLQAADQLVITTVPREDAAFTADWMLDLLHENNLGHLADNAVTLLSCPTPNPSPMLADLQRHFATRTRAVTVVPYDAALESGSSIEYSMLQPITKKAWLHSAAVMLNAFNR
jgi:MinD-like ATPase involved in chromosome partitioning or flagellar assembly